MELASSKANECVFLNEWRCHHLYLSFEPLRCFCSVLFVRVGHDMYVYNDGEWEVSRLSKRGWKNFLPDPAVCKIKEESHCLQHDVRSRCAHTRKKIKESLCTAVNLPQNRTTIKHKHSSGIDDCVKMNRFPIVGSHTDALLSLLHIQKQSFPKLDPQRVRRIRMLGELPRQLRECKGFRCSASSHEAFLLNQAFQSVHMLS
jgi:hypothetical protein